jgi:tetratricopeptide (TPR) repeat protein
MLNNAGEPFSDGNWPDPRDLSLEFPELVLLAQAAASSSATEFYKQVSPATQLASASAVYVCAEASLAAAPSSSLAMASQLASRRGLARNARLRTLGLVARAAEACGQTQAQLAALDRIMAILAKDRSQPTLLELAYGMAFSSPRGWLLPQDQIAQARLIAHSAAQDPEGGRTPALRMLASGGCPTVTLIRAIELLLVPTEDSSDYIFPSNAFLAEDLALKAIDMEPENLRARFLLATAFRAEDSPQEAIASLDEVIRLAPAESSYALTAAELKRQLLTETPQED